MTNTVANPNTFFFTSTMTRSKKRNANDQLGYDTAAASPAPNLVALLDFVGLPDPAKSDVRVEARGNQIQVFDGNNAIRVRIEV
ncbi:hypothetical protein LXM60_06645 [Pandoraea sputorum]|uniref:hypothetical protein n=1 Tax=Pandoraea sputorum TaxID=93222 RepID=UPI001E4DD258|nr:hypothetical protein [Pandoraea sputorum]MCE4059885.1 hypothetical protein [Pandoraea sputorum]